MELEQKVNMDMVMHIITAMDINTIIVIITTTDTDTNTAQTKANLLVLVIKSL